MAINPSDIIKAVIDELAMGDLGDQVPSFAFSRIEDGTVLLDYGIAGRFKLEVTAL